MNRWVIAAGVSAALLLVGALLEGRSVLAAALSAALTCMTLPIGCLLWGLMLPLIKGQWRAALTPRLLLGLESLPWALLGLLILVPAAWWLYPWALHPAEGFRGFWLQPVTFLARALLYAALWWWLASRMRAGSSAVGAGLGVIAVVLTLSGAGIDWLMSLDDELSSTIFGLFFVMRALLMGLAWAALGAQRADHRLLRGLMVGACLLWVYLHFMQYLAVWAGDLPREIQWYLERSTHGWGLMAVVLAFTQAVIPLALLTLPWGKRPYALQWACGLTLFSGLIEMAWLGLPSVTPAPSLWLPLAWLAWGLAIACATRWRRDHGR